MADDTALIRAIAADLPVGVWVARVPSGELAYANQTFRTIMGMEARDDVAAGAYAEPYGIFTLDGAPYPEARMPFVQAMQAAATVTVDDIVIHRHDGGRVFIRAWARPLFDADDRMTHVVIAFNDITAEVDAERRRRQAEAAAQQALRMETVGQLAGGVAHDFNNLLAAIRVLATSLQDGETDPERREDLGQILGATSRAADLTAALLGFAGGGSQRAENLDLSDVVEAMGGLLRRTLDRRLLMLTDLARGGCIVRGDRSQLEQVFMNLVVNARDAMPNGGSVTVRTAGVQLGDDNDWSLPAGQYVRLTVDDTGPGIPESDRDRVFEPYFTTKGTRGSGLGLATVYGIVDAHGGATRATASPSGGARLEVMLPAGDGPAAPVSRDEPALERGSGGVLIIDDEDLARQATARAVRRLGYHVYEAAGGQEGLELFRANAPRIRAVLLDMVMPGMDARATYDALRSTHPDLFVILTTGCALNEEAQDLLSAGVSEFLPKPYSQAQLSRVLARA